MNNPTPIWNQEPQAVWMATTIIVRRNLANYNFPSKLSPQDGEQIAQKISTALGKELVAKGSLSPDKEEHLFEHFLCMRDATDPKGMSSVLIDDPLLVKINDENHLELHFATPSDKWNEAWKTLHEKEEELGKTTPFAFSPKFGYLTSDPASCGTGLTVSAFLHLPALIHTGQLESALENSLQEEVFAMGITGNLTDLIGDIIVLQNNYTIGFSEENIFHAIQACATKLISAEKAMRDHLASEKPTAIKDLISKSYGVLIHSYQLETKEALDLLSALKLGIALNLVTGIEEGALSPLFFETRRGHLIAAHPDLGTESLKHMRAEMLHEKLKGVTLGSELQ